MKAKIILPIVSLTIIAILGGSLVYEIIQRHRAARAEEQFIIALSVQSYQGLAQGNVQAVKRHLGVLVTVQSLQYEQRYGQETDSKFAPMLAQAKVIQSEFEQMSK
jgi:hypothetical protein